ncbi:MAG: carboxypeptidase-like regulatory domain-containing protein [bacterium]|jgi:N,N-dimethylformamidase|nr:carboxypeptidase-like regulatory domain-containing protein [bacterium]
MLVGYVSDERYIAQIDVMFEFEREGQVVATRSRASGSVYAELAPGPYRVTLAKDGFGSKIVDVDVQEGSVHQFRLLSDCLLGYMWPKCVRAGELSEFRVHSPEAYKLELWRYGWEKEFVQTIGWYDEHGPRATVQLTPDGDYTQTGAQWNTFGYSSPHHKQYAKAPNRSGLYYMHATGESGAFFSFPWVVAPEKPTARIAVLASDITWTAYNNFGGRSNYIHPGQMPDSPTINARLQLNRYTNPEHVNYDSDTYLPLSFDRPEWVNHVGRDVQVTDPIEGRAGCHLAPAEWRLLGWLEREKFDYDYYSETQFHFGKLDLDDYQILIISTHPEYWSRSMYDRLKAWVFDRGGKLLYLGGNGLNCEVEFLDEATMVVHNGNGYEVRKQGTDSRLAFRYESEANLLGVQYTTAGIMTAAPYRVMDADHWVFAGTNVKQGDLFGHESLHQRIPGGASGHETDKIMPDSPTNTHLLARGENPDNGGADMVVFDTDSGGGVFSVGSITYVSSILVDDVVSAITANVLNRFLETNGSL